MRSTEDRTRRSAGGQRFSLAFLIALLKLTILTTLRTLTDLPTLVDASVPCNDFHALLRETEAVIVQTDIVTRLRVYNCRVPWEVSYNSNDK